MKDKKHIDELFNDRFKSFEVSPSPEVWGSIQASLESRKKDRKLIPLFWKLGGVAALLALLFTVGYSVFNGPNVDSTIVTNDETIESTDLNAEKDATFKDNTLTDTTIASEEDSTQITLQQEENAPHQSENKKIVENNDVVTSEEIINKKTDAVSTKIATETTTSEKNKVEPNPLGKDKIGETEIKKDAVGIASNQKKNTENKILEKNNDPLIKKEIGVAETSKTETANTPKDSDKITKQAADTEIAKTEEKKQSILDAIEEQKTIKAEEAVTVNPKPENRWDVAPNFAPVYYNTLGSGSSLDPSFSDNSQQGDVNFSYGVQVSYVVSERLSVRTGVSNVDLSYGTSGIELGTGPVSSALKSVDYGGKQTVLTAVDKGVIGDNSMGNFGNITPKATNGAAEITQNISYYEVPLELKYAVLNNKIGVNIIGGLSTLFLGSNDVSVNAGDFNSTLGEANNLSTVSFSANAGLGFDYKISKRFKFNVEPMFKYQLNPYTDSSVNFKPYYVGVYTGFSYKF